MANASQFSIQHKEIILTNIACILKMCQHPKFHNHTSVYCYGTVSVSFNKFTRFLCRYYWEYEI